MSTFTDEPLTLEPAVYERVVNDAGELVGWKVPDAERRYWERGSGYRVNGLENRSPVPKLEAPPLPELLEALMERGIGDDRLHGQLADLYEDDPGAAAWIVRATVDGTDRQSLHDPSAFLASRLRSRK